MADQDEDPKLDPRGGLVWFIGFVLFLTLVIGVGLWGCNQWKQRTHDQMQTRIVAAPQARLLNL